MSEIKSPKLDALRRMREEQAERAAHAKPKVIQKLARKIAAVPARKPRGRGR